MKNQNLFRISASAVMFSLLAACGGGGGDEGPENTIVKHDVMGVDAPKSISAQAGKTIPLFASAETFGPKIASIAWAAQAASSDASGSISIADSNCGSAETSSREVPGRTGFFVDTVSCSTDAIIPANAKGVFNISSIITATDGSQRSENFSLNVIPVTSMLDVAVTAKALDPVVLAQPIRLNAVSSIQGVAPTTSVNTTYEWSVLYSPDNAEATLQRGAVLGNTSEVGVLLTQPGKYVFAVKTRVDDGLKAVTKTNYVSLVADDYPTASPIGFALNAEAEQSSVLVGSPARLVAIPHAPSGIQIDSFEYKWTQIGATTAVIHANNGRSVIITSPVEGDLMFSVEVTAKSGGYSEKKTALVTLRVNSATAN
ncbi:MAG: hypothetical protein PHX60_07165 [Giesbergeria sp.]|uniref:hypothetical protein n=1 Tax=Giesbergeria sp. TaxID=2818473 RepID=UPI00263A1046|nr:hypothetical protein [Giesbergeria sp.]MDD2609466.1 hypothetical protein [Giesbergeria sp.]